uniref:Secreted protein n=1 Tax=Setaria italica TaxID=4555 RepID=K3YXG1_SETIT
MGPHFSMWAPLLTRLLMARNLAATWQPLVALVGPSLMCISRAVLPTRPTVIARVRGTVLVDWVQRI